MGRAGGWLEAQDSVLGEMEARSVSLAALGNRVSLSGSEVGGLAVEDGSPRLKGWKGSLGGDGSFAKKQRKAHCLPPPACPGPRRT